VDAVVGQGTRRHDMEEHSFSESEAVSSDVVADSQSLSGSASQASTQVPPPMDAEQHVHAPLVHDLSDSDDEPLSNIRTKERDAERELVAQIIVRDGLWNLSAKKVIRARTTQCTHTRRR
jgi:hypothetical protein